MATLTIHVPMYKVSVFHPLLVCNMASLVVGLYDAKSMEKLNCCQNLFFFFVQMQNRLNGVQHMAPIFHKESVYK